MLHSGDNDSTDLSLDMNEALAEIQMNQPWCNECQVLKQSLEDLRAACNHKATIISDLKEKIIPTDQLITDFYAKQEENQMLTKSLETCRRHCEELDQQLHSALARLEPLREANGKFERHIQRCEQDIEKLKAENEAYKICQQQSNLAHSTFQEKLRKLEEEKKEAQTNYRKCEGRRKKLQEELVVRKKEYSDIKKENTALQNEIKALRVGSDCLHSDNFSAAFSLKNAVTEKLTKFKNGDVPWKPNMRNHGIESSCPRVSEISHHEMSSLLTSSFLQMLPPMLSPMPSSEADMSEADTSDNDVSISHFASQLEAKFGCSDDNFLLSNECNDNVHANIDEDSDDDESGDDETDFTPVDEVNLLKNRRNPLTKSQLESQMSIGFDTPTDEDELTARVSRDGPKCSFVTSSLASVPSTSEFVPSNPLVQKVATEVEVSGGHSATKHRLSSSDDAVCDETSSAGVLPLDIHDEPQSFMSATQPLSCPVSENQSLSTTSTCSTLVVSSSSTSTVFTSSSFVSVSPIAVTSHANLSTPPYSLRSISSLASSSLSSAIPKSMPVCTTVAPVTSSEVTASSSVPGMYSTGASLPSPTALGTSENALPCGAASTVSTCNQNSSAVCHLAASTDVHLTSACLPVCASDVESHLTSLEIPVMSAFVSATSSQTSNSVSVSSPCVTVITQCASAVIVDSVLQSSSRVSGVISGTSKVVLPSSADVIVSASKTVPLCSPCVTVAASSISRSTLPCVSAATSSTLNTSSSSVVTCNSVPLCSSSVTANAPSTTHDTSMLSCVGVEDSTACSSVVASSVCVTVSNSAMTNDASLSSHSVSVELPTSMPFPSCTNKSTSLPSLSAALFESAVLPCKLEPDLNHSSLRSQISIEEILNYVHISPPLSPMQSPRNSEKVESVSSEIDSRGQAVKQKTSILGFCPIPSKVLRMNSSETDVYLEDDDSDDETDMKTNDVDQQTVPVISNPAVVLPTIQKSYYSELIESVIKEALALTEDVISMWFDRCRSGQTPGAEPWLTPSQRKLISDIHKQRNVTFLQEFCKRAVQVLSLKGGRIIRSENLALCCIFVAICRSMGDVERLRVFVHDAVKCQFDGYVSLITAVAAIWPLPLIQNRNSPDLTPVLYVLQHAIFAKSIDVSKPKHLKMKFCLEQLCGWGLPVETVDEIARHLLAHLECALNESPAVSQELTWNVELAFDLLCVTDGWQWSNNFVVVQLLWPILASWAANPADVKNQAFIEAVIGILGLVMSHCPAKCRSNTDHILHILLKLLREPTVAVSIQVSVLRALLLLAKYQPDCCATMCLQWVKDHKNDLDTITKAMLRDFHKQFSSRLKYLSQLVID